MRILLTNDDGIFAPGLAAIYKKLTALGDVTVVAPSSSRSGASHSVTFNRPFVCSKVEIQGQFTGYSVDGSPADCVKLAVFELCKEPIDLLVSGINNGANTGINIYYSGTVAAAMEGIFLKIPSVAMSLAWEETDMDFELAAEHCFDIIQKILPVSSDSVININIPHLSRGKPKGVRIVPQSHECFHEYFECRTNEQGQTLYQLAGGQHRPEEILTDTVSIADGFITITPLSPGRLDTKQTKKLKKIKFV
ncbi:MAG: 5'/3'-nucleotidase SurE [Phycisphaerae bacterium]|jgi:5'-nucleotidase